MKVVFIVVIAVIICFCVMFSHFCVIGPFENELMHLKRCIQNNTFVEKKPSPSVFHLGEETSRALKTLRSSKAPLVKKRQVMRAISGDYRKKIEEERSRQFKLIQSGKAVA